MASPSRPTARLSSARAMMRRCDSGRSMAARRASCACPRRSTRLPCRAAARSPPARRMDRLFLLTPTARWNGRSRRPRRPSSRWPFSPDGARIAAASPRGAVGSVRCPRAGNRVFALNGPGLPVWSLAFTPDGRQLLTGGGDRIVRRWDARTGDHLGPVVIESPADAGRRARRQPRRRGLQGLRGLPYADARWRQPGRADAAWRHRPAHRHGAGLQLFAGLCRA